MTAIISQLLMEISKASVEASTKDLEQELRLVKDGINKKGNVFSLTDAENPGIRIYDLKRDVSH